MIARIQYISQGDNPLEHIQKVLEAGCRWIQLRMKNADNEMVFKTAHATRTLCDAFGATFILNDHVDIAKQCNADGVHLGQNDMPLRDARKIVGPDKIIGGTANTLEEVEQHLQNGADYIGLGPFRFTTTKEKLQPVLGEEGYREIMHALHHTGHQIPVVAIGGITEADVHGLMQTGIHGIAVSGLLTHSTAPAALMETLSKTISNGINNS